ncbi:M15 family metallopeptidase [Candidatus Saccharibacteria bacterium]|nr:M15 family metallopeptidase [Candidatus Saccharibacteria bacterium]
MKKVISLILCYLFVTNALFALAENYHPSPSVETKLGNFNPYLAIVNKEHKLPDDWLDWIVLKPAQNSLGENFLVEEITLAHFNALREELLQDGIQIELDSTYRSPEEQQAIWNEWSADPEKGPDYCKQYLAEVGYSEHHTGLAIDIFVIKPDGTIERENDEMIADRDTFAKIHEKLAKYGFILRYPEGKEDITGYTYEPWHLRFVGENIARDIFEQNLTLEEYLEQHPELQP